jgi:hypothetical protein
MHCTVIVVITRASGRVHSRRTHKKNTESWGTSVCGCNISAYAFAKRNGKQKTLCFLVGDVEVVVELQLLTCMVYTKALTYACVVQTKALPRNQSAKADASLN